MFTTVLDHLSLFPEWYQNVLIGMVGLSLFLFLFAAIKRQAKRLEGPSMQEVFRAVVPSVKALGVFLQKQTDDPIKLPKKVDKVLDYVHMLHCYAWSIYLFLLFLLLGFAWSLTEKQLSVLTSIHVMALAVASIYMAKVFKADGGKMLVKLRAGRDA